MQGVPHDLIEDGEVEIIIVKGVIHQISSSCKSCYINYDEDADNPIGAGYTLHRGYSDYTFKYLLRNLHYGFVYRYTHLGGS